MVIHPGAYLPRVCANQMPKQNQCWLSYQGRRGKYCWGWQATVPMPGAVAKLTTLFALLTMPFYSHSLAKEVRKVNLKSKIQSMSFLFLAVYVLIHRGLQWHMV